MSKIMSLTPALAISHHHELAQLYFSNMQMCSHLEHFTFDDAYKKIESFIDHLEHGTCVGFAAFDGDEICGFVWAYPHQFREEQRMYVSEIRVREDHQGRGIGKQLLRKVEDKTKELGISALYLHAEADNPVAIRLYESIGFQTERIQLRKDLSS